MQFGKFLASFRKFVSRLPDRKFLLMAVVISSLCAGVVSYNWITTPNFAFEHVRASFKPSDLWVVDRNGLPLESIRTNAEKRSLDWVEKSEVSPAFWELLIQAEDQRYYSHKGVDPLALLKAFWEQMSGSSKRGASTLTMQLGGLLKDGTFVRRKNVWQKVRQIIVALKLNSNWSKEQVLEAYVNLVPFRGELIGLRAASLGYFKKSPSGLLKEEAALLVALLRAPNATHELVAKRACQILGDNDCQSIQNLSQQIFTSPYRLGRTRELIPVLSNHFLKNDSHSSILQTTLDFRIQELTINALREQLRSLKNQNVNDAAAVVLETTTGRVVAYVGNAGARVASAEQIDGIQMRRQAGSTIKPFVYATAFEWKLINSTSLLDDSPADISISQGRVYHPKNYDRIFRGLVSVGDSLGSSLNVPAVRALQLVGETRILDNLRSLGFERLQDDEYYGPSLALGAIDVTLWELSQGFRQFALESSIFSNQTRHAIFNILASSEHRRFTFGMGSSLSLPFPAAVKTGTSKDMRDNWCIGWTSEFTVGVWVGNFNGEPMWNVSGMSGAAPVWRSLMLALHPNPKGQFANYEPPSEPLPLPSRTISRIKYPAPDMLVGFDPDIPVKFQKLPIEIENPQPGQKLFLNDLLLSKAKTMTLWPLQRGKFRVELKTVSGQSVDSVKFEVR